MTKKKKYKIECDSCDGTGLYSGMAEKKGCAVICHSCDGTGWVWHTVPAEFVKRKVRKGIKRVFKNSCGYLHGAHDATTEDGRLIEFSKAGCSYKEFLDDKRPKPVKELYCPYLWSGQQMQHKEHRAYGIYDYKCRKAMGAWGGYISSCSNFERALTECWPEYEKLSKDWDD